MKFAFVIFKYFPFGGAQRDMMRIARQCVKVGHTVHIYTLSWEGPEPDSGITKEIIPAKGWLNHHLYHDFITKVQTKIHMLGYDTVVGFNRMSGLDVYFAADPCFIERNQGKPYFLKQLSGRYKFFAECERAVFSSTSACQILLLSLREQPIFQKWYGTPDARFHLIPPAIVADRYADIDRGEARRSVRAEFGWPLEDQLLLMVGSGFRTKGLDRTLEALTALPVDIRKRTRLLAVGQDNAKSFLAMAKKLEIQERVVISGGREDIPRLMHAADLLVHPARSELAGHVLLEAMASGLPVLASDVCGYASHIEKAEGGELLRSPFDQLDMNYRLEGMLMAADEDKQVWGDNGRKYMKALMASNDGNAEAKVIEAVASRKAAA
jgi:UDP-glucose:(heptosyl)LPS alpha-1,3-glucosyltransferase